MTKQYKILLNLVLLSAILFLGTDIFYRAVQTRLIKVDTGEIITQRTFEQKGERPPGVDDYRAIINRDIFGSPEKPLIDKKPDKIEALEPTSLKVALLGTVAGSEESAVAVIEDTQKKEQGLYHVGDSIQDATIKEIMRGKVVLRVNGKDEILTMAEPSSSKRSQEVRPPRSARPNRTAAPRTITLRRSDVEKAAKDINTLMAQARVAPHFKDGDANGFSITNIKSGSIYRKMGLRNRDIIHGINDKPITSPDDLFSVYNDLTTNSNLSLQIERRGRLRTINYRFR